MYEIQTYLGADGLMHCTVCKEPVEAFYPKGSLLEMRKHHRQCACERKAYAEETQYYKEKEHRELIARNKKICFEEKEMEGFTFQNVERDSGVIRIAEEYVTNWQKMKQNHMGYLFWGPVGTGKSYLAACIANALLEKEVTVKMTNFNTILIHIVYFNEKKELRIHHFVSDSNDGIEDPGGKFGEALEKLVYWCEENNVQNTLLKQKDGCTASSVNYCRTNEFGGNTMLIFGK